MVREHPWKLWEIIQVTAWGPQKFSVKIQDWSKNLTGKSLHAQYSYDLRDWEVVWKSSEITGDHLSPEPQKQIPRTQILHWDIPVQELPWGSSSLHRYPKIVSKKCSTLSAVSGGMRADQPTSQDPQIPKAPTISWRCKVTSNSLWQAEQLVCLP